MKFIITFALQILIISSLFSQVYLKDSTSKSHQKEFSITPNSLNFIAMGDWGRDGDEPQVRVANQMTKIARACKIQFVIATGDNFYPSGVISKSDPSFKYSFEEVYKDFSLHCDWYPVLGNHDYMSNPDAEVQYSKISRRWQMPARYYSKLFNIPNTKNSKVLILFIDTNPLIPDYYKNSQYGPNVKTQDSTKQKQWIESELSTIPKEVKWTIVVAHHPLFTGGNRTEGYDTKAIRNTLKRILDKYKVDAYISGHEHSLQHLIAKEGKTNYFISGAASEKTPTRLVEESKMVATEYGFMLFSIKENELLMQTINDRGSLIYSTTLKK